MKLLNNLPFKFINLTQDNSEHKENQKTFNNLRAIFLFLFRVFVFIIIYYYCSINFNSISRPFIENQTFFIQFNLSLFIFATFSNLFGWKIGFISGFLGEFLYQLSFFPENSIYIDWIIIIGLMGLLFGIYEYKPLKYQKGTTKIFNNFLVFIISSFSILILSVFFTVFNSTLELELILLNVGFKLFMEIVISAVFLVPILIFIIDMLFSSTEREIYNVLLTHHSYFEIDHTFKIKFGRTNVYFCSRCSGMIISLVFSSFIVYLYENITKTPFNQELAFFSCVFLPIPGLIDWSTQKLKYRKSNTNKRLITGFLLGMSLYFLAFTRDYLMLMSIIIIIYFSIFFSIYYVGYKKELKEYKRSIDQLNDSSLE